VLADMFDAATTAAFGLIASSMNLFDQGEERRTRGAWNKRGGSDDEVGGRVSRGRVRIIGVLVRVRIRRISKNRRRLRGLLGRAGYAAALATNRSDIGRASPELSGGAIRRVCGAGASGSYLLRSRRAL
jgi:hypothetical protein